MGRSTNLVVSFVKIVLTMLLTNFPILMLSDLCSAMWSVIIVLHAMVEKASLALLAWFSLRVTWQVVMRLLSKLILLTALHWGVATMHINNKILILQKWPRQNYTVWKRSFLLFSRNHLTLSIDQTARSSSSIKFCSSMKRPLLRKGNCTLSTSESCKNWRSK